MSDTDIGLLIAGGVTLAATFALIWLLMEKCIRLERCIDALAEKLGSVKLEIGVLKADLAAHKTTSVFTAHAAQRESARQ
jgi:hypothetical protein